MSAKAVGLVLGAVLPVVVDVSGVLADDDGPGTEPAEEATGKPAAWWEVRAKTIPPARRMAPAPMERMSFIAI